MEISGVVWEVSGCIGDALTGVACCMLHVACCCLLHAACCLLYAYLLWSTLGGYGVSIQSVMRKLLLQLPTGTDEE